jgi:hypothetical protein
MNANVKGTYIQECRRETQKEGIFERNVSTSVVILKKSQVIVLQEFDLIHLCHDMSWGGAFVNMTMK